MKYNVGDVIKIKEGLQYLNQGKTNKGKFNYVNPVEYHFRGCEVKIVNIYTEHNVKGYGVKYFDSREFFVHELHIEEE